MRKILFILFLTLSSVAMAQPIKYNSMSDACNRNQVGSGVTNNTKTIYVQSFEVGQPAYLNNINRDFKRLVSGYYYHSASNSSFTTNARGLIIDIQSCNVDNPPVLTAPDWNIGRSNMFGYGSSWQNEFNKMSGGTSVFWFYGKSNGNNYPNGKNGNGYETVHFSSHSITTAQGYSGVISKCRYYLRDASNNIILYVDDTKGGFHYFYGNDLRANNHPDDVLRYLPVGIYSLEYTNTSDLTAPQRIEFFQQHENNNIDYQINEVVQHGETIVRQIVISDSGAEPNTFYKFNNNLF